MICVCKKLKIKNKCFFFFNLIYTYHGKKSFTLIYPPPITLFQNKTTSLLDFLRFGVTSLPPKLPLLLRTSSLPKLNESMFFVMRKLNEYEYVYPMWEDVNNKSGGCWSFKIDSQSIEKIWQILTSYLIGENIGNMEAMRRLWNQIGVKAIYQGYPYRVAVIAGMSALLNVCEPFK